MKTIWNRFRQRDAMYGLLLGCIFLILYFVVIPLEVEIFSAHEAVQADFFPKLLTILLIFFSGLLMVVGLTVGEDKRGDAADAGSSFEKREAWKRVGLISLTFIVYLGILTSVGFIISSLAFLLFSMNYFGSRKWVTNIILSIVFVLGVYFVFRRILHVDLPQGILGF
jgi:putative tricarboxylic transport membrane protein